MHGRESSPKGDDGEFRVRPRLDGERSLPVDVVTDGTGRVARALRPPADCRTTSPAWETEVPDGADVTIRLRDDCAEAVALSRIAIRSPVSSFAVGSPTTLEALPAGAELPIVVQRVFAVGVPDEELLPIETSAPVVDRRPITLHAVP